MNADVQTSGLSLIVLVIFFFFFFSHSKSYTKEQIEGERKI